MSGIMCDICGQFSTIVTRLGLKNVCGFCGVTKKIIGEDE